MPAAVLRDAAGRLVEATSLRMAAAELGISHSGLRAFLRGTEPYARTLAKLHAWYARTNGGKIMTPERARALFASMLEGIPPNRRGEVERQVWALLEGGYRDAGAEPPDWLRSVRNG